MGWSVCSTSTEALPHNDIGSHNFNHLFDNFFSLEANGTDVGLTLRNKCVLRRRRSRARSAPHRPAPECVEGALRTWPERESNCATRLPTPFLPGVTSSASRPARNPTMHLLHRGVLHRYFVRDLCGDLQPGPKKKKSRIRWARGVRRARRSVHPPTSSSVLCNTTARRGGARKWQTCGTTDRRAQEEATCQRNRGRTTI